MANLAAAGLYGSFSLGYTFILITFNISDVKVHRASVIVPNYPFVV
jgi:hypothetical protein